MDDPVSKPAADDRLTRPDPTTEVPPDQRTTAADPLDVQARVEAAVRATEADEAPPREDSLLGTVVGHRFEIVSRIGAGGMGVVYKARQLGMDRWVAVKVLLKELAHDNKVVKRFKIEALAASRLTHPNTIRIYDFGQTEDANLYIAMEFLEGQSLHQALRREGPMPARRVLHILKQIAASLSEAHSKGIVHRDLKPDNIFLTTVDGDPDFVKVLDFGVAKLREADRRQGTLTQAGVIFGTPRYMAPEQCRSLSVDHRADLYALGVIAYEALTGVPPFDAESPLAILIQHVQESPRPLAAVRPDVEVPEEVERLVMRCLEKSPERRFHDAAQLQAEAARIEAGLAGRFERVVFVEGPRQVPVSDSARTAINAVSVDDLEAGRRKGRGAWPWWVAAGVVGAGVGLGVWNAGWFQPARVETTPDVPLAAPAPVVPDPGPATPAPIVPRKVLVRFVSEPAGARVLDGEQVLGETPFSREFEAAAEVRHFRFERDGFQPAGAALALDRGGEVAVTLKPVSTGAAKPKKAAAPRKPPDTTPTPPKEEGPSRLGDLKRTPY